ncbi:uncharacterized protein ACIBXB_017330 isoform 1-T1 [Morphnus guianensis]
MGLSPQSQTPGCTCKIGKTWGKASRLSVPPNERQAGLSLVTGRPCPGSPAQRSSAPAPGSPDPGRAAAGEPGKPQPQGANVGGVQESRLSAGASAQPRLGTARGTDQGCPSRALCSCSTCRDSGRSLRTRLPRASGQSKRYRGDADAALPAAPALSQEIWGDPHLTSALRSGTG